MCPVTTKKRLQDVARTLFNTRGYTNVTLREIAIEAGTTIGNLTYHFPRKEALLLEIQHELYTDFLRMTVEERDGRDLIEVLAKSLKQIQANRTDNAFFYTNIVELSHDSPAIASSVEEFRRRVYSFYLQLFDALKDRGMARQEVTDEQYRTLSYTLVSMAYMWMQNTTIYHDQAIPRVELADAMRDLTLPHLTQQGREAFAKALA